MFFTYKVYKVVNGEKEFVDGSQNYDVLKRIVVGVLKEWAKLKFPVWDEHYIEIEYYRGNGNYTFNQIIPGMLYKHLGEEGVKELLIVYDGIIRGLEKYYEQNIMEKDYYRKMRDPKRQSLELFYDKLKMDALEDRMMERYERMCERDEIECDDYDYI